MNRWLWRLFLLISFLVALVALVAVLAYRAQQALQRARVSADLRVLIWSRVWTFVYGVPYALHLAILGNEGASTSILGKYPRGDTTSTRGPALGPGQVLASRIGRLWSRGRRRTWEHGDWDDKGEDVYTPFSLPIRWLVVAPEVTKLELVDDTRESVWASVVMLREALDETGNDWRAAARRYNGFGNAADAYAQQALARVAVIA